MPCSRSKARSARITGTGTLAGRDSFLGFQGSWGLFRIGRFHAPYDNIHEIWGNNPTLLTGILATSAIWAQGFTTKQNGGFDDRVSNSVRWDSPVMSGFQLQFQYGNGGAPTGSAEGGSSTSATELRRMERWPVLQQRPARRRLRIPVQRAGARPVFERLRTSVAAELPVPEAQDRCRVRKPELRLFGQPGHGSPRRT